ncbi:hypothetical protein K3495_g14731 [Podosphaera aphanis]|nr:hypothetical protein K3495_g14731 [Podosphaera aphanis]
MKISHIFAALLRIFWITPHIPVLPDVSADQAISMAIVNDHFRSLDVTGKSMENGLNGPCKAVTIIYARGTAEPGNVGDEGSPGPAWFAEMRNSMGEMNLAIQGVNYSGDLFGYFLGGDPVGSKRLLSTTKKAARQCPDTKIILGGYSQGAQLVHNAATRLKSLSKRISAVVLFGDPFVNLTFSRIPPSKVLNICHLEDIICRGFGDVSAHFTYANHSQWATEFSLAKVGRKQ